MKKVALYRGGDFQGAGGGGMSVCPACSETSLGCCGCVNPPGSSAQPSAAEPCCVLPSSRSRTFGPKLRGSAPGCFS